MRAVIRRPYHREHTEHNRQYLRSSFCETLAGPQRRFSDSQRPALVLWETFEFCNSFLCLVELTSLADFSCPRYEPRGPTKNGDPFRERVPELLVPVSARSESGKNP